MSWLDTNWWLIPLIITFFSGILCPAMGTVLITHKRLLQVNLISHCVLPGLALAMALGINPSIGGVLSGLVGAIAAESLTKEGISVEVIDPRTLVPLDKSSILDSVEKTGRLVLVDPAHKVCSAASEIASIVAEEGFWSLQAPIQKVASEQVHIPFTPALEKLVYPDAIKISNAVKKTLED